MPEVRLSVEEYLELLEQIAKGGKKVVSGGRQMKRAVSKSRKASAYSKRYGAAFKRLQKQYKTKSGSWRKGGFKRCQKAAHAAAKRGRK